MSDRYDLRILHIGQFNWRKIDHNQCTMRFNDYRSERITLWPMEEPMVSKFIAAAFLATALMTGVASAQTNTGSKDTASTSATMQKDEYSAYKLVGINVYNQGNEKIGEVKDILLEKSGKAEKVILSVGGFLGLGERYVAVPYDQIKWVDEPVRSASSDTRTTTGSATTSSARKWYPDHAVYNATKDQLKAMPEFKY
jgi:sporulation protein YlmC with PRC-barrel domain